VKQYTVNEIFYSLQGEGVRAGTANVFIRFSGCNLECDVMEGPKSPGGFACDTEFTSGRKMTSEEIIRAVKELMPEPRAVVLTGGEPMLQVDRELLLEMKNDQIFVAIETNGSVEIPLATCTLIDWICVSPKVAEHALKELQANEVKYVRHAGQGIPKTKVSAMYKILSPAWAPGVGFGKNLAWCIQLIKENPEWRLSIQQHKIWGVR
jgi:7-carboxy-7-deazaguanine synthase